MANGTDPRKPYFDSPYLEEQDEDEAGEVDEYTEIMTGGGADSSYLIY